MKKAVFLLIILSLMRVGVVYADAADNTAKNQDYFFGVKNASSNLNQVLALLVGPAGQPGPAGVAGKDGLIGMNGKDGLPGAPGVAGRDGAAGRDGTSVLASAFTGAQGTCTAGGTKFVDAAGTTTYACNGASGAGGVGPAGPQGPQGPEGPAGSGGGGGYGAGTLAAGSCETDNTIYIDLDRKFTGTKFVYNNIFVGKPSITNANISAACATKAFTVKFTVRTPGALPDEIKGDPTKYVAGNTIVCTRTLPAAAGWPTGDYQFTFGNELSCTSETTATVFRLNDIDTADTTNVIGFELGN